MARSIRLAHWTALLALMTSSACLREPGYTCESNTMCFLSGVLGECDLQSNRCVYPSNDCRGELSEAGYVDGEGNCVPEPNAGSASSTITASASSSDETESTTDNPTSGPSSTAMPTTAPTSGNPSLSTDPSASDSTTTSDESDSMESTANESAESSSTGTTQGCASLENLTGLGMASATTTYNNNFLPPQSVDGNLGTSWFSTGPEAGGAPSVFTWRLDETDGEICIDQIHFYDNSEHTDPSFRSGFGFASATIRLIDANDTPVFERIVPLPNTPPENVDGDHIVEAGGVFAQRVVLELSGHENTTCGGFSELQIFGSTML